MISRFAYFKPHNLNEAVQYLEKEEKSFVLAGGTDLMILLRRNLINAEHIVDIKALPETADFSFIDGAGLTIGASVVVNRVGDSEIVKAKYPALNEAAASLASFQLRNRATVVGNICNASPGADLPPALLVYDAIVNIAGPQGTRQVPLHEFFTGRHACAVMISRRLALPAGSNLTARWRSASALLPQHPSGCLRWKIRSTSVGFRRKPSHGPRKQSVSISARSPMYALRHNTACRGRLFC